MLIFKEGGWTDVCVCIFISIPAKKIILTRLEASFNTGRSICQYLPGPELEVQRDLRNMEPEERGEKPGGVGMEVGVAQNLVQL